MQICLRCCLKRNSCKVSETKRVQQGICNQKHAAPERSIMTSLQTQLASAELFPCQIGILIDIKLQTSLLVSNSPCPRSHDRQNVSELAYLVGMVLRVVLFDQLQVTCKDCLPCGMLLHRACELASRLVTMRLHRTQSQDTPQLYSSSAVGLPRRKKGLVHLAAAHNNT